MQKYLVNYKFRILYLQNNQDIRHMILLFLHMDVLVEVKIYTMQVKYHNIKRTTFADHCKSNVIVKLKCPRDQRLLYVYQSSFRR